MCPSRLPCLKVIKNGEPTLRRRIAALPEIDLASPLQFVINAAAGSSDARAKREDVEAASRRLEEARLAPGSVTVITRTEIEAFGYPTLTEALRGVRGMFLTDDSLTQSTEVRGFAEPDDTVAGTPGHGSMAAVG